MNLMNLQAKKELLFKQVNESLAQLNKLPQGNCTECEYMEAGTCKKWKEKPPEDYLVTPGQCDEWIFDGKPVVLANYRTIEVVNESAYPPF